MTPAMLSMLRNLFGSRSRGFNPFGRRRHGIGRTINDHRGGAALGSIAALAVPFLVRHLRSRHSQRATMGAR